MLSQRSDEVILKLAASIPESESTAPSAFERRRRHESPFAVPLEARTDDYVEEAPPSWWWMHRWGLVLASLAVLALELGYTGYWAMPVGAGAALVDLAEQRAVMPEVATDARRELFDSETGLLMDRQPECEAGTSRLGAGGEARADPKGSDDEPATAGGGDQAIVELEGLVKRAGVSGLGIEIVGSGDEVEIAPGEEQRGDERRGGEGGGGQGGRAEVSARWRWAPRQGQAPPVGEGAQPSAEVGDPLPDGERGRGEGSDR